MTAEKRQALRAEVTTKLLKSFNQDAEPTMAVKEKPAKEEAIAESLLTDIANIVLEKKETAASADERGDSIFANGSYVD